MIRRMIIENATIPQAYFILGMPGSGKSTYAKKMCRLLNLKDGEYFIQDDDEALEKYSGVNGDVEEWMVKQADKDIEDRLKSFLDAGGKVYINSNVANVTPRYVARIADVLCDYYGFEVNIIVIDSPLADAIKARSHGSGERYVEECYIEETYDTIKEIIADNGREYCKELEKLLYSNIIFRIERRR